MFDGEGERLKKLGLSWAWLPQELLILIVELVKKLEDFVAFGAVCKSWNAAARKEHFKGLWVRQKTPYLLLCGNKVRDLYSLAEGEIVASVRVQPSIRVRKCFESLGWFLAVGRDRSMCLLNPFSNTVIPLPSQLSTIPDRIQGHPFEFVRKMVLSASPSVDPNFTVAVLLSGHSTCIALWRSGDTNWTLPETCYDTPFKYDVTYYDGHFYSFNDQAQIKMYTFVEGSPLECKMFARLKGYSDLEGRFRYKIDRLLGRRKIYIIRTENRILLVVRSFTNCGGLYGKETTKFQVLEFCTRRMKWGQIDDLGNMAIFVGSLNATTMVDVSRYHGFIKANHIYFINYKGNDIGAYDLKTGTIEPVYHGEIKHNRLSPATWIMPSF